MVARAKGMSGAEVASRWTHGRAGRRGAFTSKDLMRRRVGIRQERCNEAAGIEDDRRVNADTREPVKHDTSVLSSSGAVNAPDSPAVSAVVSAVVSAPISAAGNSAGAPQDSPCDPALPALRQAGIGRALVLGGGYTGGRFALRLAAAGVPVLMTSRQPPLEANGPLQRLRFDPEGGCVPSAGDLEGITHLLVTIPPNRLGQDPVLGSLGPLLDQLPLRWVGYLSSTGVYGNQDGGWVDETSPTRPNLERSQARLACERAWRERGLPLQVLRLPAIYGPGRTPFRSLQDGSARLIHKPDQVFCRIHVDDILGALAHCLALPADQRPATLIVADDRPCPSSETLGYASHLLGCRLPEVERYADAAQQMSPMARSFWTENRRVSNRLLCQGLGYRLRYPSYREGYRACLAQESPA